MDLPVAEKNLQLFKKKVKETIVPISCYARSGLDDLKAVLWKAVKVSPQQRSSLSSAKPKSSATKKRAKIVKPKKSKPSSKKVVSKKKKTKR
jgi:hypothetical protein